MDRRIKTHGEQCWKWHSECARLTLEQAIDLAIKDHGGDAPWSDGEAEWALPDYIAETVRRHADDPYCGCAWENFTRTKACDLYEREPVDYDGRAIRRYWSAEGRLDRVPMLRLRNDHWK